MHHFISCNLTFDGNQFCEDLQKGCECWEKKGKTPCENCFAATVHWPCF